MTKTFRSFLSLSFLLALSSVPAAAQTVLCSKTMNAKSCDRLAEPVEAHLKQLNAPADWTYVILDGRDWRRASKMFNTERNTTAAFTVLELRTTFFSAEYVQQRLPRPCLDVVAHELAHITCGCASEQAANYIASVLIAKMNDNKKSDKH